MKIEVKNNDPIKAYKVLMKKLAKENHFKEASRKRYFRTKQEIKKEKDRESQIRFHKAEEKRQLTYIREESRQLTDSKKRAKNHKQGKSKYKGT